METSFKENLRTELDYLGLTVKELSAKTGIPKGTLNCYLGARASMPPVDIALKIAEALDLSVEYLATGKERKNKNSLQSFGHNVRSIIQIILEMDEVNVEIVLDLVNVVKKHAEK
jgi:transcriptional regulator with XRE-family HTH domain